MKSVFLFFFTCLCFTGFAQNVQWATEVLEVSSQHEPGFFFKENLNFDQYPAQQILGKPNVLPNNAGDSPNAWVTQKPDETDYIKVGFERLMKIRQVVIAESFNPSAVYQIYAYDTEGNEHLINTLSPTPIPTPGRLLNVIFNETEYQVNAVKVVLNGKAVPGYSALDAIGISDSSVPVSVKINVAANLNNDLAVEKLSNTVNSPHIDLNPIIAPDGKVMYFSRNSPENTGGKGDFEDIWYAERDTKTGEWQQAQNLGAPLNNKGSNFVSSIALDGDKYLLLLGNAYKKNDKMEAGVSISRQTKEGWSKPTPLTIENFYNLSPNANYFLTSNQKVMLMSLQREDSRGLRDLYVSFPKENNSWSEPLNLGDAINTAETESSPFLALNDSTLFFSSRGYSGFGGDDVFMSRRLDDTWQHWSEPENMGPVVNSKIDDTFFTISLTNEYAYLTRRSADTADMYEMRLPIFKEPEILYVVRGKVLNAATNEPVAAQILFNSIQENTPVTTRIQANEQTGEYEITLPKGKYNVHPELEHFKPAQEKVVTLAASRKEKIFNLDLYLTPEITETEAVAALMNKAKSILPAHILFDFDKASLLREASTELNAISNFMAENKEIGLEISGFTCAVGPANYNQVLSELRAKAVAAFLIKKGISESRIKTSGFGESNPIASNDSPESRKENRRVEFKTFSLLPN